MKEQFGGRFGISLTLAPDYWYLRGFKPAAMQEHVDFMGFMAYDLHGPWDTDVRTLGSIVRPQTDITEIDKNLKPLWFDGVDPSKINLGLAYYGRTYKLTDPACGRMGCSFISGEGGAVGSCTNTAGVLSNREIRRMIDEEKIQPYFNETAMVKYFTYAGNSWVGYDDAETYALKEAFANDRCLGGIMIWSVDFDDETGIGLNPTNEFKSPESATIIPMAHTTVKPGQTFTLGPGASTDLPRLPNGGDQNVPAGPGGDQCNQCSFFRLITSTCCGSGGSVGNPILIPAGNPTPMDIPLPAGFTPNEEFKDPDGNNIPANKPLPKETILPQGTTFTKPFVIAPGEELKNGEGDETNGTNLIWLSPEVWNTDPPDVQCNFPCTFVFPPYPKYTTTLDYPRVTITESGTVKTTRTFPPLTISLFPMSTMVVSGRDECTDTSTNCEEAAGRTRTSIPEFSTTTTWPPVTWTSTGRLSSYTPPPGTRGPDDPKNPSVKPPCLFCPPGPPHIKLPGIHIHPGTPKPTTKPCSYPGPTCPYPGPPGPPGTNPPGTGPPGTSVPPGGDPDEEEGEEEEEQEDEEESLCLINPSEPEEPDDPDQPTAAPTTPKTSSPTPSPTPSPPTNNFKPECSGSVEAPDIVKSFRE
jgi:chitinase